MRAGRPRSPRLGRSIGKYDQLNIDAQDAQDCQDDGLLHWKPAPAMIVTLVSQGHGMKPTRERGRPARTRTGTASAISTTRLDRQRRRDRHFLNMDAQDAQDNQDGRLLHDL